MNAATIWLIVMVSRGDGGISYNRTPHPTYASCHSALAPMKIAVSPGNENELGIVAFCAADPLQRLYSDGKWVASEVKK